MIKYCIDNNFLLTPFNLEDGFYAQHYNDAKEVPGYLWFDNELSARNELTKLLSDEAFKIESDLINNLKETEDLKYYSSTEYTPEMRNNYIQIITLYDRLIDIQKQLILNFIYISTITLRNRNK